MQLGQRLRTPHATRSGLKLELELGLHCDYCVARARVCVVTCNAWLDWTDLGLLCSLPCLAWLVMDFQLRADRVCCASRCAPNAPKVQVQFRFRFSLGCLVACRVACLPHWPHCTTWPLAVLQLAVGHNLLTISACPGPVCVACSSLYAALAPSSVGCRCRCRCCRCCCPFKGRTLSAAFRGTAMLVVLELPQPQLLLPMFGEQLLISIIPSFPYANDGN